MIICRCASCKKDLGCDVEGFDGKTLFISLDIHRLSSICKECNHMQELKYQLHFCSAQCLKDYIIDPECLDQYIEEKVYGATVDGACES